MNANAYANSYRTRRLALILSACACALLVPFTTASAEDTISPDARKVTDEAGKAGTDVRKVEDSNSRKASPDARRVNDSSAKAGPDAARVRDGDTDKASPDSRPANPEDRLKNNPPPPGELPGVESTAGTPAAVEQSITETETSLRQRKLEIRGATDARVLIADVIGKNSRNSRAEIAREQAARVSREDSPKTEPASPTDDRREAADFLRQRLRGEPTAGIPSFFRLPVEVWQEGSDKLNAQDRAPRALRYLHGGQRFIYFPTREEVPAVLLANAALDSNVMARPAQEVVPIFHPDDAAWSGALLPEEFKGQDAWVFYYPVEQKTMVASWDVLFEGGTTRFADRHAYDLIFALASAISDPSLANERFVIEDHSPAVGEVEDNLQLSQQRAEAIAREMVRLGIEPERLIPVGFGELEARKPDDASGAELAKDRRLMVFRLGKMATPDPRTTEERKADGE